jgi:hypothetical protein
LYLQAVRVSNFADVITSTDQFVCLNPELSSAKGFLFVGFVDFLIGSFLLLAVGLQSTYLPHTLSGCDDATSLGLTAPGNTTNLFRFVGQLDDDTPEDVCQSYMTTWIMGIVLGYENPAEPLKFSLTKESGRLRCSAAIRALKRLKIHQWGDMDADHLGLTLWAGSLVLFHDF